MAYPLNVHTNRMLALEATVDMGMDTLNRANALMHDGIVKPEDVAEFERLEGLRADSVKLAKRYSYAAAGV